MPDGWARKGRRGGDRDTSRDVKRVLGGGQERAQEAKHLLHKLMT